MSLNTFFHDPTWLKVHGAIAIGTCGIPALVVLRIKTVRARKRDIYKPSVLQAETYGTDDLHEAPSAGTAPAPSDRTSNRRRAILNLTLTTACIAAMSSCYMFALHNYIILDNWDEGNGRLYIRDYVGAIVCYKKAMRADPSLSNSHLLIGIALLKAGRARNAVTELRIAAKGDKSDTEPLTVLGDALMILKRPAEAVEAYRRAIDISPSEVGFYIALANALQEIGKPVEAYAAYEKAIDIDPRNVKAHTKIGELLIANGHMDEGLAHCRRAVALAPRDIIAHNTLATALARVGLYDEAIVEYRKSIDLDPTEPLAYYDLGATLERKNDFPNALQAFKKSATLKPRNKVEMDSIRRAQEEIERLER